MIAYLTDVEGRWDKAESFVDQNPLVSLKDGALRLADGVTFVFGGDAIDRGPHGRHIVALLLAARTVSASYCSRQSRHQQAASVARAPGTSAKAHAVRGSRGITRWPLALDPREDDGRQRGLRTSRRGARCPRAERERGSQISLTDDAASVLGATELDDGRRVAVRFTTERADLASPIGRRDRATGQLVKARLADGDYLLFRALPNYRVEQTTASAADLARRTLVPAR